MLQFEVIHYAVHTELRRVRTSAGVQTYASRILKLNGQSSIDATLYRASLQFSTLFEPWCSHPAAGRLERSNPLSLRITAWLPLSEFPCYYDILRCERPVYFACETRPDGFLTNVHLGSNANIEDLEEEESIYFCSSL